MIKTLLLLWVCDSLTEPEADAGPVEPGSVSAVTRTRPAGGSEPPPQGETIVLLGFTGAKTCNLK